jgi:hypothetical protein
MKKKILLLICAFFVCISLLGVRKTEAAGISTMYVWPSTIDVSAPGQLFTVYINITNCPTMDFYDIYNITWDSNIIQLQHGTDADLVEGPFMKNNGNTIFVSTGIEPGKIGEVACGFTVVSTSEGDGNLFLIKFNATAVGTTQIIIGYSYLLWGVSGVDEPNLTPGTVNVIPEFSASVLLPLLLAATAIAIIAARISTRKKPVHPTAP